MKKIILISSILISLNLSANTNIKEMVLDNDTKVTMKESNILPSPKTKEEKILLQKLYKMWVNNPISCINTISEKVLPGCLENEKNSLSYCQKQTTLKINKVCSKPIFFSIKEQFEQINKIKLTKSSPKEILNKFEDFRKQLEIGYIQQMFYFMGIQTGLFKARQEIKTLVKTSKEIKKEIKEKLEIKKSNE